MKIYTLNPMKWLAMQRGYNRPLDRHDFPHGTIPDACRPCPESRAAEASCSGAGVSSRATRGCAPAWGS
jgi:hypothetical protein